MRVYRLVIIIAFGLMIAADLFIVFSIVLNGLPQNYNLDTSGQAWILRVQKSHFTFFDGFLLRRQNSVG